MAMKHGKKKLFNKGKKRYNYKKAHKKYQKAKVPRSGISCTAIVNGVKTKPLMHINMPLPQRMFKKFSIADEHQISASVQGAPYSSFTVMLNSLTYPFYLPNASNSADAYYISGFNGQPIVSGLYAYGAENAFHLPGYFQTVCNTNLYNNYKVNGVGYEIFATLGNIQDCYNLSIGAITPGNTAGIGSLVDIAVFMQTPTTNTYQITQNNTVIKGYVDLRKLLGLTKIQAEAHAIHSDNLYQGVNPSPQFNNENFNFLPTIWSSPDKLTSAVNSLLSQGIQQTRPQVINQFIGLQVVAHTNDNVGFATSEKINIKLTYYVELFNIAKGQMAGPFNVLTPPDTNVPN